MGSPKLIHSARAMDNLEVSAGNVEDNIEMNLTHPESCQVDKVPLDTVGDTGVTKIGSIGSTGVTKFGSGETPKNHVLPLFFQRQVWDRGKNGYHKVRTGKEVS